MIPKPLNEIEWADIEALRDSGREEDDTIEYKGSFSGGADFIAFNDGQRTRAVAGIAREALAFLNGRGGDIVIGVREANNDHPKIEEIISVENVNATADRLAQSLAAVIEPVQSILGVRAITEGDDWTRGVIVVRAPSSLRAPHRFTGNKECYIRRGRESVPMPMDEIQDITLGRAMRRAERNQLLEQKFATFESGKIGTRTLPTQRFHIRVVFVPNIDREIQLDAHILSAYRGNDLEVSNEAGPLYNDVAFRELGHNWKPDVRGKFISSLPENGEDVHYCHKSIKQSLVMSADFSSTWRTDLRQQELSGVYGVWVVGFLANSLVSIRNVLAQKPEFGSGTLRISLYAFGNQNLITGDGIWARALQLPNGVESFPDFEIEGPLSIDQVFRQAQVDLYAVAGIECPKPYCLPPAA